MYAYFCEESKKFIPVYDGQPYEGKNGVKYPYNFPRDSIPDLKKVKESQRPDDPNLFVIGFSIDAGYNQVWNTRPKTPEDN